MRNTERFKDEVEFQMALMKVGEIGKDFGFMLGTTSPYPRQGLYSVGRIEGYIVWRKDGYMLHVPGDIGEEDEFQAIVSFIKGEYKGPWTVSEPVGEYSPDVTRLPK